MQPVAENKFLQSPIDKLIEDSKGYELPKIESIAPRSTAPDDAPAFDGRNPSRKHKGLMPPEDLQPLFEEYSAEFGVPLNVLAALGQQESTYNPMAVGTKTKWGRAKGIMQYIDPTAESLGINPFDPKQSIRAAAAQMRERLDKGYTIQEAIMAHHGGDDRKQWGPKTKRYVQDVIGKAGPIGDGFMKNATKAAPDFDPAAIQAELDAKEPGRFKVMTPEEVERYQKRADVMRGDVNLQAAQDGLKPGAPSPLLPGTQTQQQAAPSPLTIENQQRAELGLPPKDTRPYQGFVEATGKSLANVPERFQQSIAGLIQMAGEDLNQERERFIADRARQYGITPGDMKLLAWAGNQKLIDPKTPIPDALKSVKENIAQSLNEEQLKQLSAAGIVNPDEITGYAKQWRSETQKTMEEVRPEPGSAAFYGSAAIGSLAEMAPMIAGAIITRSPKVAMGIMGGQVGGQAYATGREKGLSEDQAQTYALLTAAAEAAPEALVIGRLLKPGAGAIKKVLEGTVLEGAQESVTAALQAGIDQQMIDPNMTLKEALVQIRDSAIIGALAGGGMGGVVAGADALANRGQQPAAQQQAQDGATPSATPAATTPASQAQTTPAAEVPEQVQAAPVAEAPQEAAPQPPSGPLSRAASKAVQSEGADRVVVQTPAGPVAGTVESYENGTNGSWSARILGDDGQFYQFSEKDGVQIAPEASADTAAPVVEQADEVEEAAPVDEPVEVEQQQEEQAPEFAIPAQPEAVQAEQKQAAEPVAEAPAREERTYDQMEEPELRERLKYLAGQAKAAGGWNTLLVQERRKVEKAINAVAEKIAAEKLAETAKPGPETSAKPAEPPAVQAPEPGAEAAPVKWFGTQEKADAFIAKKGLADTHQVVQEGRRFEIREKAAEQAEQAGQEQAGVTQQPAGKQYTAPEVGQQVTLGKGRAQGTVTEVNGDSVKIDFGNRVEKMSLQTVERRMAAAKDVAGAQEPKVDRQQAITEAQGAAAKVLSQGGTEADASRAATDLLIERMADDPSISIANDAPVAVQAAKQSKPITTKKVGDGITATVIDPRAMHQPYAEQGKFTSEQVSKAFERVNDNRKAGISSEDKGPHYAAGHSAFRDGKPRELPSYFTDTKGKNAKDWYRGYDAGKAESQAPVAQQAAKPVVSENKVFTEDAAEKARALLKSKLTQLNSGIDPEIMQAGITLAGYHIEKGARTFAAYAKAMTEDLGEVVRPYLKSWYMGVKYDPRAAGFDGMSDAAEVEAYNLDEVQRDTEATEADAGADTAGAEPGRVQADEGGRAAGAVSGEPDGRVRAERGSRKAERAERSGAEGQPEQDGGAEQPVRGDRGNGAEPSGGKDSRAENYRIQPGELKRTGSWKATAEQNVRIVELTKQITAENRQATPDEKALLTKFTGWGASEIANGIFPNQYGQYKDGWRELGERLKAALTDEEYAQAKRTTQYAHYTSEPIIRSVYSALDRMGFNGGQLLEPGMGVGLFNGLMPDNMVPHSTYTGIEYDTITGNIARLLYPQSNIVVGDFTQTKLPKDFFDAAIGNPPFGQIKIQSDPEYKKHSFLLHDYFFAKTIDRVKPGGLLVFVTSKGTMDKANDRARKYLGERADLVGAIRLPQTAFKDNAGTEVVTDVIFLRKRDPGKEPAGEAWAGLGEVQTAQGPAQVNEYFAAHPEMVLGKHAKTGSMYRADEYTVEPIEGDIEQLFAKAIENLPQDIYRPERGTQAERAAVERRDYDPKVKKEGGIYVADDGALMQVESGQGVPLTTRLGSNGKELDLKPREVEWLKGFTTVRDALKQAQYDQLNDGQWERSLKALNKAYASFTKDHGQILAHSVTERENEDGSVTVTRRFKNEPLIRLDAEGALAYALEVINTDGTISKGAVLNGRTLNKPSTPAIVTDQDAMFVSLNDLGRFDLAAIAKLAGKAEQEVISSLGTAIYQDPAAGWTTADDYLSGNVVRKLKEAQAAARVNKAYERNVEALKSVQPRALAPVDISVQLGSAWVPASDVQNFAAEVMGERLGVSYSPVTGQWNVTGQASGVSEWGTGDKKADDILEAVLNNRQLKVTYKDADGKTHTDPEATEKVNDIAKKLRTEFKRWIWSDSARADRLAKFYNEHYNNIAPRQFDGSHLTLPGVSSRFDLRPHQKRAIWRTIQQGDTYYAHAVGAGKTFTMIASGMEERRLGLSKKPMYVVPNHMLAQFSKEFLELYPTASIMVADEQNFHTHNRRKFVAQAALNDPDAIVITHSAFGRIGMSADFSQRFIEDQIGEWQAALDEVDKQDRVTRKQIERRIEQLENRLKGIIDGSKKDQVLSFEELGVDRLYVDEGHEFRKLDFPTNRGNIKGIDSSGSQRSMDLFMKVQYLHQKNPNRALVMASGTPITNTMGELFTVQRFFQPAQLEEDGDGTFDAWANHYGEVVDGLEQNAAGLYETVTRFAKFVNVPELMSRVRSFMDILTSDQLGELVQRPDVETGGRQVIVTPSPDGYKAYQKGLEDRIKAIRNRKGPPKPGEDIILNVIADGRFSAIDMRFVDPTLPSDPNSKLNRTIDDMIEVYRATAGNEYSTGGKADPIKGGSLMLFTDIGLGEQSAKNRGFDMKAWIEKRLIEGGVKPDHIAFMRDNKAHAKKERLFDDLRQGRKRILIGGKDMETGVNAQKRLVYLGHLDAPWFPASVEQREGRIVRQGNQNPVVAIKAYATKGSYDSTMWGMNARKARFIEQAMNGDSSVRSLDDVSEASAFEMAAALASGDERYLKLAGLKADTDRLGRLYSAHMDEQRRLRSMKMGAEANIKHNREKLDELNAAIAKREPIKVGEFSGKVGKSTYDSREEFGNALFNQFKALAEAYTPGEQNIGSIGGFQIAYNGVEMRGGDFMADATVEIPGDPDPLLTFPVDPDMNIGGIATRAANQVNGMDREVARREEFIASSKAELQKIERRLGVAFPEQAELREKQEELSALESELEAESKAANADAAAATVEVEGAPDSTEPRYSVRDGVAQAEFGPVFKADSAEQAIERLMADKKGEAIITKDGIGDISLVYGNQNFGLGHIARRRGESFMQRLPELLEQGEVYTKPGQTGRVFIGNASDEAAIRLDWDGKAKTWLVSAYERYPDLQQGEAQQVSRRSQVVEERSAEPMTIDEVRRAIAKGPFKELINRMIDKGMISIHASPKSLPESLGKDMRGAQAVTAGDGTIYLVANNLTPSTANAVLMHEMFHSGVEKLVGSKRWSELQGRLASLYRQAATSTGKANELHRKALARVSAAKRQGAVATKMEVEEFGAYLIEEYERSPESLPAAFRKWVEDLIGAVKAWLFSRHGKQLGEVTPAQLAALAKDALLVQGLSRRGELFGPIAEKFSVQNERDLTALQKVPTESGAPAFRSNEGVLLYGGRKHGESQSDFDDRERLPYGHRAHVTEGNSVWDFKAFKDGQHVANLTLQLDQQGNVDALHDIKAVTRGHGAGEAVVASILAASRKPLRIIQAVPTAKDFWSKMGANGFFDLYDNTEIDWSSYEANRRGSGRPIQPEGAVRRELPANGEATARGQNQAAGAGRLDPLDQESLDYLRNPDSWARFSVLPDDTALEDATKALDNSGQFKPDFIGQLQQDIGRIARFILHPRQIAALHKDFAPVYRTAVNQFEMRDSLIDELQQDHKSYDVLPQKSKERVNSVLELGRLLSSTYSEKQLQNGIINPGAKSVVKFTEGGSSYRAKEKINALLSGEGEVIKLDDAEIEAYQGLRAMFDNALDKFKDQTLIDFGFPELAGQKDAAKTIMDMIDDTTSAAKRERLEGIARFVQEIEQAKRTGYVPFARYGDYVVAVKEQQFPLNIIHDPDGGWITRDLPPQYDQFMDSIGAEYDELEGGYRMDRTQRRALIKENERTIHSAKVEFTARDKLLIKAGKPVEELPSVKKALAEAEKWKDGNPDRRIVAFETVQKKPEGGLKLSDVDALAEVAMLDTDTWDAVRDQLSDAIKGRSFRKHFFQADNVPGYTADFERSIADYMAGMAGYLSRRHYNRTWDDSIAEIKAPRLFDYANKYRAYANEPQEELAMLRQVGFFHYIAGVPATAIVNLTQPFLMTIPALSQIAPMPLVVREMARAYKDALAMVRVSKRVGLDFFDPTKAPADIRADLVKAWGEGMFVPLQTYEVMATARNRNVGGRRIARGFNKTIQATASLFSFAERLNRLVTFIASARLAQKGGVKARAQKVYGKNALAKQTMLRNWSPSALADFMIDETQFRMGKANRPVISRGLGAVIMQFKGFVMQSLETWFRLATQNGAAGVKAVALSIGAMMLIGGLWGMPGADDLRDLIEKAYKQVTKQDLDLKTELRRELYEATGQRWISEVASKGATYPFGLDFSRVGMGNVAPDSPLQVFGIPADLFIGRPSRAFGKAAQGDAFGAVGEFLPNFLKNPLNAYGWNQNGVRDGAGRLIMDASDVGAEEMTMKSLGFQPSKITDIRDYEYAQRRLETANDALKRDYLSKLAKAIALAEKNPDKTAEAMERHDELMAEIDEHNAKASGPEEMIIITRGSLKQRIARELGGVQETWGKERKQSRGASQGLREVFGLSEVEE